MSDDTVVVDDPDRPLIPHGCIGSDALLTLATALDKLEMWHHTIISGAAGDKPCLRRLESADGVVTAHVSIGPPIGGTWERFILTQAGWQIV